MKKQHHLYLFFDDAIISLVLNTNCFASENKYYQQIRGGAMGLPLTMTIANIYMLECEQSLLEYQKPQNELYGRYVKKISLLIF